MSLTLLATLATVQLANVATINYTIFTDFKLYEDIRTFVLFDYKNQWSLLDYLPHEVRDTPHLVISQEVQWKLKNYFGEQTLSVVHVRPVGNDELLRILNKTMHRWHLKYVLFITSEPLDPLAKWRSLFEWCHAEGFFNTLLADFNGSLAAFDHFATQQVIKTILKDFIGNRRDFSNAQGFPIRATLGNHPPRALIWYDSQGSLQLSGYYGKALSLFAQHYNACLDFVIISHMDYYNELECLEYLAQGKADLCADAMPMSHEYITTHTEEISNSYLVVPYDKPLERLYYFLKPFQPQVWLLTAVSLVYKVLTLSFIKRWQRGAWNLGLSALNSWSSALNLSFHLKDIQGWRRTFVECLMIAAGFIVANWYLALLSSVLFSRLFVNYITSLEDLVAHNITIMINEFEQFTLNASDISPLIAQQLRVVNDKELLHHRRNLIPSFAYYSQYEMNFFYLYQQKFMLRPRMKELSHIPINPVYGGIPLRSNWPLEAKLNNHMRNMVDSGIYLRLMSDTIDDAIRMGHLKYFPTEYHSVEPLGVEYFHMAAVLLAGGYIAALLSFIMELCAEKYKAKYK